MTFCFDKGVLYMKSKLNQFKWFFIFLFLMNFAVITQVSAVPPVDGHAGHEHGRHHKVEGTKPAAADVETPKPIEEHSSTEGPSVAPAPAISAAPVETPVQPKKKSAHDRLIDSRETARIERSRTKEHDEILKLVEKNKNELYYAINNKAWTTAFWEYRLKLENAYHLAMNDLDNDKKQKAYDDVYNQTEKALKTYYGRAKSLQDRIEQYNSMYDPDLDTDVINEMFGSIEGVEVEEDVVSITFKKGGDNISFDMNSIGDDVGTVASEPKELTLGTLMPESHDSDHSWLDDDDDKVEDHDHAKSESDGTCKDCEPSWLEKSAAWLVTLGAGYMAVDTARKGRHFAKDMWKAGEQRVATDLAKGRNPMWGMQMMQAAYNYDWTTPVSDLVNSTLMSVNGLLSMSYGHGKDTVSAEEFAMLQQDRVEQRQMEQWQQYLMWRQMSGNSTMSSNTTTNINLQALNQDLDQFAKSLRPDLQIENWRKSVQDLRQRSLGGASRQDFQDTITKFSNIADNLKAIDSMAGQLDQMFDMMGQIGSQAGNVVNNTNNYVNGVNGGNQYGYTRTTTSSGNSNWQSQGNGGNTWAGNPGVPQMPGPQQWAPNAGNQNGFQFGAGWSDPNGRGGQGQFYSDPTNGFGGRFGYGG